MAGTIRTKAEIDALLANNTAGDISPQDVRDATVSAWGDRYVGNLDTQWPASDAGDWVTVEIDDTIDGQAVLAGETWRCAVDATLAGTPANWVKTRNAYLKPRDLSGVQDFDDTATFVSPIQLTTAGTWYDLTNDGLGPLSSQAYAVNGHGPIFNTTTGEFDFSDLKIGDLIRIRADISFGTTSTNTEAFLRITFGLGFIYSLKLSNDSFKNKVDVGDEESQQISYSAFQIKSSDTLNNPAKLQAMTDGGNDEVVVGGWQIETEVLS